MRRYDEPIEVRSERLATPSGEDVGPAQFVWRRRIWKVVEVENRWFETADWWTHPGGSRSPGASAAGGDGGADRDLLAESEVWRVVAASGRSSLPGVYELARGTSAAGEPTWRLRAVVD